MSDPWDAEYGELQMYIDNDYALYQKRQAIESSLETKVKRGKYDPSKAPKAWMFLVDEGARKYCKEFGCSLRDTFPKKDVRDPLAVEYARDWEAENKVSNPRSKIKWTKFTPKNKQPYWSGQPGNFRITKMVPGFTDKYSVNAGEYRVGTSPTLPEAKKMAESFGGKSNPKKRKVKKTSRQKNPVSMRSIMSKALK